MPQNWQVLVWGVGLLVIFFIGAVFGGMFAFFSRRFIINRQLRIAERKGARMLVQSRDEASNIIAEGKKEAERIKLAADNDIRERRTEAQRRENRLIQKEETLDRKLEGLERREQNLNNKEKAIDEVRTQAEELKTKQLRQLELISGLSTAEAKQQLIHAVESEMKEESTRRVREWETRIKEDINVRAQEILSEAIQRYASEVVSETTTSVVPIPSDEMKGRLIGREGRNIRALEQATGVDLIIDDTPEAVTLSCFDPIRREVARLALSKLILDGRIHPARIEGVVAKAKEEMNANIVTAGEQAAFQAGVPGLNPEIIKILGRLKYRTSYGQNVLAHSVETANISGLIASDIGANVALAKKAGLLHDLGKATDHEVEGNHAEIGADIVKQWDKSPEVVRAIAEHHGETGTTSVFGFIVAAADAISSARPGARRESLENYLKRLQGLEEIANQFKGVEKSYAIQAGREIRILVKPEEIDDLGAMRLARDIVKKIEEGMEYPGQIKVTVLRETRAVDYAK